MIILDGGMGQELVKRAGKATDLWSMQALLDSPEMVRAVHDEYFAAGAQIATTNTYSVLPDRLESKGLADKLPSKAGPRPKRRSTRLALGESWMPAPAVRWAVACSSTMTSWPPWLRARRSSDLTLRRKNYHRFCFWNIQNNNRNSTR